MGKCCFDIETTGGLMAWYAVSTRAHGESRAAIHLKRQGFEAWLPLIRKTRRHARRIETIEAPLFPGYLFVAFDASQQPWRAINGTFGVRRLICQGDLPIPVPDSFFVELRSRCEVDGFFSLPADELRPGTLVQFRSGPFTEQVATLLRLSDNERIWLLLDLLGRPVTVMASRQDVVAVA
jgi:transcriptional antiterminator RfaH